MSTKLQAWILAEKRYPVGDEPDFDAILLQRGYANAIEEVAQPLADERDELKEVIKSVGNTDQLTDADISRMGEEHEANLVHFGQEPRLAHLQRIAFETGMVQARSILAKHPSP